MRLTSDLAPYLPRADVVLTGHACAPAGQEARSLSVRLAIFREEPLLEKIVHVHGDLRAGEPSPFERIPLVYERAYGGIGWEENPLGIGAGAAPGQPPNLVHPADPTRLACFGPIARSWPGRRRLLAGADRKALERPLAEVPAGFDWSYFNVAPRDQRIDYLRGDEWIILDGLSAEHPHLHSYLPRARGLAQVYGLAAGEAVPVPMVADTLRIDADELRCTVVWRGSVPISEAGLAAACVYAALECHGQSIAWPAPAAVLAARPPPPERRAPAERDEDAGDEPLSGERLASDDPLARCLYPSDLALFKVRADVVLGAKPRGNQASAAREPPRSGGSLPWPGGDEEPPRNRQPAQPRRKQRPGREPIARRRMMPAGRTPSGRLRPRDRTPL